MLTVMLMNLNTIEVISRPAKIIKNEAFAD